MVVQEGSDGTQFAIYVDGEHQHVEVGNEGVKGAKKEEGKTIFEIFEITFKRMWIQIHSLPWLSPPMLARSSSATMEASR